VCLTPLFATGGREVKEKDTKTTISWMGGSWLFDPAASKSTGVEGIATQGGRIPYMVYLFEQTHPNIDVVPINHIWEGYESTLKTRITAKDLPDLTNVHMRWMYDIAKAGGLADVTDFIKEIGIDSFASGALEGTKINGKYYGVPYRSSGMAFYWNKNIFRAAGLDPEVPPKTWDEVLIFSKIIKEKTGKPGFALDSKTNDGAFNNIITLVNSFGGQVIDKEKMICTLDEPAGIKAAQFIYELNKSGANIAGAVGLSNDDARQLFNQGQVGMNYEGPWATADLRLAGQVYGVDYGVTFMPSGDPNKIGYSPLIGWALTYPSWLEPEKMKNVQELIKFILEPENMEWFMSDWGTSYLPALNTPAFAKKEFEIFNEQLKYTLSPNLGVPNDAKIREIMAEAHQSLTLLKTTPEEAFRKATKEINALLSN
jgi:multiple sugar transport system substrate-binding protein